MRMKNSLILCIVAAGLIGCSDQPKNANASSNVPSPAAATQADKATPAATPASAPAQVDSLSGTAVETLDAAGYTYIKVKNGAGEQWAAVPQAPIKKGDKVTIAAQMTMENFESKSLNRKFDSIVFGSVEGGAAAAPAAMTSASAMQSGGMPQMPAGHPAMPGSKGAAAMGGPKQHMSGGSTEIDVKVPKADGPDGRTVAEVWSSQSTLKDKPVVVRGKVVKFNGGIMGRNWVHVRDGSGSADKGDHDLTITTNDVVAVGDVVTVKGVVRVEKDFGAGYLYPVIVEEASVKK